MHINGLMRVELQRVLLRKMDDEVAVIVNLRVIIEGLCKEFDAFAALALGGLLTE